MAPMCGLSTRPYRILARRFGSAVSASEMIASEHLVRLGRAGLREYAPTPEERPAAVQVVGARPAAMAESAAILEDLGADVVDVNMGCPARRILEGGGGAALMRDPNLAARIVRDMVARVRVPVTVKIRAGWDDDSVNAVEIARAAEEAGAAAVTVHARTREARHRGEALLDVVGAVREAVGVPVIGNGGLREPADAAEMIRRTGCAGVMIGRAAIGDVWLFGRTAGYLRTGVEPPAPTLAERMDVLEEHLRLLVREYGEAKGVILFRKCVPHYVKGLPGAREARGAIVGVRSAAEVIERARAVLTRPRPASPTAPPPPPRPSPPPPPRPRPEAR